MRAVDRVIAVAGQGLRGDRYAVGAGHWSAMRRSGDSLTLVQAEDIDVVTLAIGLNLPPGATRRNITTQGIQLDDLLGRSFRIGEVECLGIRRCEPCSYLDELLGQEVLPALVHRGGIRAEIITGGAIAVGDPITRLS